MLAPAFKTIYTCFPGGRNKVLTMSYDDGRAEDRKLVGIFNKYRIRGTFNLNTGIWNDPEASIPPEEYPELYKGHEVACHGYTHPNFERCSTEQIVRQVFQDRYELEALTGAPVRGFAYPYGLYSDDIKQILRLAGFQYGRIVPTTANFSMPKDFMEWCGTCHHNENLMGLGERFAKAHAAYKLYIMYVWGHSYEFTKHDNWQLMEDFCAMIGGRDDIWYATNIEIVDYMDAAGRLQFTAAGDKVYNPSACSVWLDVNGEKAEIPGGTLVTL